MLILLSDREALGARLTRLLFDEGIFLCRRPLPEGLEKVEARDTGEVILDFAPDPSAAGRIFEKLKERYPALPIAGMGEEKILSDLPLDALLWGDSPEAILPHALRFARDVGGFYNGTLSAGGLSVPRRPSEDVEYLGRPIPLPPREHVLLRALFYRAPLPVPGEELLELCYPEGGQTVGNIGSLVRRVNERFCRFDPRPLIVNRYRIGYSLREGIVPPVLIKQ